MCPNSQPTSTLALEQELRRAIARYEAILASTLDPVITIDFSGRIVSASESVQRVFGWSPSELLGRNVSALMPEPHRTAHDGYLEQYRRSGRTNILGVTREFEAEHRDGTRFPIELSVARVDIPGETEPLFTGIVHDITAQRANEVELARYREHLESLVDERSRQLAASHEQLRAAERLVSIGTLAAGVGHDINNLLLPMRSRLDAIAAALPAGSVEHVNAVKTMMAYLQELCDGLHLLAMNPDDAHAATSSTDVRMWWEQVGALLGGGLPKGVSIATDFQDNLPSVAIAPHRLTQAILNLIVNAGEASSAGTTVTVKASRDRHDPSFVRIAVTDEGRGMPPEVQRQARDPFFTTKKRGLGTGLGLSLADGAARTAGGAMEIESAPQQGTTVALRLPVGTSARAKHVIRGAGEPDEPPALTAVLTVSEPRIHSLVSLLLSGAGVAVQPGPPAAISGNGLWITTPEDGDPALAAAFASAAGRRVVVLGIADRAAWDHPWAILVAQPTDMTNLRQQLTSAIAECCGDGP